MALGLALAAAACAREPEKLRTPEGLWAGMATPHLHFHILLRGDSVLAGDGHLYSTDSIGRCMIRGLTDLPVTAIGRFTSPKIAFTARADTMVYSFVGDTIATKPAPMFRITVDGPRVHQDRVEMWRHAMPIDSTKLYVRTRVVGNWLAAVPGRAYHKARRTILHEPPPPSRDTTTAPKPIPAATCSGILGRPAN